MQHGTDQAVSWFGACRVEVVITVSVEVAIEKSPLCDPDHGLVPVA